MHKRIVAFVSVIFFLLTAVAGRCFYISTNKNYTVSKSYNSYKITIGEVYTSIYDRNMQLLNNNKLEKIAVITPNEKAIAELPLLFTSEEMSDIYDELKSGIPVKRTVTKNANTTEIKQYYRICNDIDTSAKHIILREYGGLESYVSKKTGELYVNFAKFASGRLLDGDNCELINDNYNTDSGIAITIDSRIQKIAEAASAEIPKGAVVIMDVNTSQVLASVSMGNDYINRAISAFTVGSIFKLVVCSCALENGIDPKYNCTSAIKVGDTVFSCQKKHSHGTQNMKEALANSCNCYFVNLALQLGADKLYDTAEKLGFTKNYSIFDNWEISAGSFPKKEFLNNYSGQLALTGFGQGKITDTPIHFASVVSCIANGGRYFYPTLKFENDYESALSDKTCKKLREYMKYVVDNGTGISADYKDMSAGKTATAQSGIYENGREVLNTWFAGFYPYDSPKYSIVIMQEDGTSGAENCCPVFRTIVENLDKL